MADLEFLFAVTLADESRFDAMLGEIATSVLGHIGYSPHVIGDILGMLHGALEQGAAEGLHECDAQFRAEAGHLHIVVAYAGGREWRAMRPLPPAD